MTTLKEQVEHKNEQERLKTLTALYEHLKEISIQKITKQWAGIPLFISINADEIKAFGYVGPHSSSYSTIASNACGLLNKDPYLKGFNFSIMTNGSDSDGHWGNPVEIKIDKPPKYPPGYFRD